MSRRLLSLVSVAAVALSTTVSAAIAQAAPTRPNDGTLSMVMIDQAQLSASQRSDFQRYLQTANLPSTKVGKRCQYYGKPQVWCLLLEPSMAQQVYQKLSSQPSFGSATEIKTVRRIRGSESN